MSPPFTVFDVGANVGSYIRLAECRLEPHAYVIHAFEPASDTFRSLEASFGSHKKVRLNNTALGLTDGVGKLYSDGPLSGLASLTQRDLSHEGKSFGRAETVRITTLERYCRENRIDHIDLLKIDVEGHDLDVMKGGEALFHTKSVGIVAFEFGSAQVDTRIFLRDMYRFVREQGMEVFRITRSGYLYHIPTYHARHEQFWTTNFLCIREDLSRLSRTTASSRRPEGRG